MGATREKAEPTIWKRDGLWKIRSDGAWAWTGLADYGSLSARHKGQEAPDSSARAVEGGDER